MENKQLKMNILAAKILCLADYISSSEKRKSHFFLVYNWLLKNLKLYVRFSHVHLNMNFVLDMLRANFEVLPRIFAEMCKVWVTAYWSGISGRCRWCQSLTIAVGS